MGGEGEAGLGLLASACPDRPPNLSVLGGRGGTRKTLGGENLLIHPTTRFPVRPGGKKKRRADPLRGRVLLFVPMSLSAPKKKKRTGLANL